MAAGAALGIGELLAGLFTPVPSPLAAVGGLVVDSSPSFVKDFAISVFGTADKAALAVGTTIIALGIGWFTGVLAARQRWVGAVVFALFAALGVAAGWSEPFAEPVPLVVAIGLAATTGWLALDLLLRRAEEVAPTDGLADDAARRRFIRLAAGGSVAALAAGTAGRTLLSRLPQVPDVAVLTVPDPEVPAVGDAAGFDVAGLTPVVVPNDEFYRIDTALVVPRINEQDWQLRVHGLVEREVTLSYDELLAMPLVDDYVTIACVSNEVGGDLVGNAQWTGVLLTEVLDRAGLLPEAGQLVGRSIDGFTAGFPAELAYDGRAPLIAVGMNGEPLPRLHGFPARLIVPGLYGYVSATKWLTEIELTTWEGFDGYWIPRGWAKEAPIKTQSRIDVPRRAEVLTAGRNVVAGVAWAPLKGIERVEVRVGEGPWQDAEISDPLSDKAWVQWRTEAQFEAGSQFVSVRATDGNGEVQTERKRSPRPDGATGHHTVLVQVE